MTTQREQHTNIWRDRINEWNGQRPDDTRTIFVLGEIPLAEKQASETIGKEALEDFYKTGGSDPE